LYRRTLSFLAILAACSAVAPLDADARRRSLGERTLELGMRGTDVRVLQDFLTRAGSRASVDGLFGPSTRRAVRRWERGVPMRVDGRVSPGDARVLRARIAGHPVPHEQKAAPVERATLTKAGLAVAPASAPATVKQIIAAANRIATKPYRYGGGHGRWNDTGYDCSGSMSYALHGAGLLDTALNSTGFQSFGVAGKGRWVTTYAHGGHSYMVVAGLRFDTSGLSQDGSRWHSTSRSAQGYTVRHPRGL